MPTNPDPVAFGAAVKARREELQKNQIEVWADGGPSNSTLTTIENGRLTDLTAATAKKLDKGLEWPKRTALTLWRTGELVVGRDSDASMAAQLREIAEGYAQRMETEYQEEAASLAMVDPARAAAVLSAGARDVAALRRSIDHAVDLLEHGRPDQLGREIREALSPGVDQDAVREVVEETKEADEPQSPPESQSGAGA